jgi:hypothetical protein
MLHNGRAGARHAGTLYRRSFRSALRPIRKVEAEADHLREVEQDGEAGATPYIVLLGVFFFLLPIFVFMLGVAFAAYYLTR